MNINQIATQLHAAGFELYNSFNEGLQHEIYTCTKGQYNGEVVDVYYNYRTGAVHGVDYSAQFKNQAPIFRVQAN